MFLSIRVAAVQVELFFFLADTMLQYTQPDARLSSSSLPDMLWCCFCGGVLVSLATRWTPSIWWVRVPRCFHRHPVKRFCELSAAICADSRVVNQQIINNGSCAECWPQSTRRAQGVEKWSWHGDTPTRGSSHIAT